MAKYEVSEIKKVVDIALNNENALYNRIKISLSENLCNQYLQQYPFGQYRLEVNWNLASTLNSWNSYKNFLDYYPNSSYSSEAKVRLASLDKNAFDSAKISGKANPVQNYINMYAGGQFVIEAKEILKERYELEMFQAAKNSGKASSLQNYIETYPNGKFINEATAILKEQYENEMFESAKSLNTKEAYMRYLNAFLNIGKYRSEVESLLEKLYFDLGDNSFRNQNWNSAITNFEEYLTKFPDGE